MASALFSRLSSKGQVTLPKVVRDRIGAKPGDAIRYEVKDGTVILTRVEPFDVLFHAAVSQTLDEWNTPQDEEAFRDL